MAQRVSASIHQQSAAVAAKITNVRRPKSHELKASRDYSSILSGNAEVMETYSSGSLIVKKLKFEVKIDCVEPKKAEVMHNKLQSSLKVLASDKVHKTSLSMSQSEEKKVNQMPRKFQPSLQNKKGVVNKTSRDYSSLISGSAEVIPKKPYSSGCLIALKRKSEKKIDCVKPKKARVMQKKLQSSLKVQSFDHVRKTSISMPQSEARKANGMPHKFQFSPRNKKVVLDKATKAPLSKLQSPTKQNIKGQQKKLKRETHETYCDKEFDMSYISSLCQNIFRRNRTKQVHDDIDVNDDCMVSSFTDILKEERRSANIAKKEDQMEQLRIQREERERERKLKRLEKKKQLSKS